MAMGLKLGTPCAKLPPGLPPSLAVAAAAASPPLPLTSLLPQSKKAPVGPVSMAGLSASSKGWPLLVPGSLWTLLSLCMPACFFKTKPPSVPARTVSSVGVLSASLSAANPIAIASAIVRSWNRALLAQFPPPPEGQYCGSPGHSAVSATLAWLRAPCVRGAELDLRKAFDSMLPFAPAPPPGWRGRSWTICGAWFGVLPAIALFMGRARRKLCALPVVCLLVIPAALPFCPLSWGPGPNWLRPSLGLKPFFTWMIGVWLIMPPRLPLMQL